MRIPIRSLFILGLYVLSLGNSMALDEEDPNGRIAWRSVTDFLSWTKFWYGTFYGEDCYKNLVGKEVPVHFSYATGLYMNEPTVLTYECDRSKRRRVTKENFAVYVEDTNIVFKIDGFPEIAGLPNKPRAQIGSGSIDGCKPPEFMQWTAKNKWIISFAEKKQIPRITLPQLPPIGDNLGNKIVLKAVEKSMSSYLKYLDLEGPNKAGSVAGLPTKVNACRKILLGRFKNSDPFLIVYCEADGSVHLLDFLSEEILSEGTFCMPVYSALPYMGPFDIRITAKKRGKIMEELVEKLKVNSIELEMSLR